MAYLFRRRGLGKGSCSGIVAASNTGIEAFRSDQELPVVDAPLVFRWGCTSNLPEGVKVVNHAAAIHRVNNKTEFRKLLNEEELCPTTWFKVDSVEFPCVVRPKYHHQGRHLHLCNNREELLRAVAACGEGWYASAYVNKVAEFRVFVVQGRVVWVAEKKPNADGDIAWNVFQGGSFKNVRWDNWPLRAVKTAIQAFLLSKLDFGGVDVMVDGEGKCYVLEINSAPSQTSEYRQTCTAKAFDYIVTNGKDIIPLTTLRGGYRKFIHPAICDNAVV